MYKTLKVTQKKATQVMLFKWYVVTWFVSTVFHLQWLNQIELYWIDLDIYFEVIQVFEKAQHHTYE